MTSVAGRSGSVQTNRRSSLVPGHRSGRSSRTQTARTTRPLRKRAATRQVRYCATSSLPYRIRVVRCSGSASTLCRVMRGPYLRGRPRRRCRGGRGTAYSARSRRARPITARPAASAAWISRARMNQASSRSRTRPSRCPSRRSRKRALVSLPRSVPRRTRRSISGTAPTRQPRSTTAARHNQPWPRRNRDRFGLAAWLWWTSDPGARAEIRSTTVSSMTTCQTGGSNSVASAASSACPTARHAPGPPQQPLPAREPRPAAALEEPVVGGPPPRQPGRQDRVGDVAAAGGRGADQQLGEGGAGAPRHGSGEAADERGQERWDGGGGRGHRSNRRWTTRRGAPRYRPQPPPPAPARAAPATPPCSPGRARPCKLQLYKAFCILFEWLIPLAPAVLQIVPERVGG